MADLEPDRRVLRRMHFSLHGHDLRFLRSSRAVTLTDLERSIWNAAEAEPTIGELSAEFGPEAEVAVVRMSSLRLVDLLSPAPLGDRRHIVVVEPHSDDAVLSVGGLMWAMRADVEFTVATVFSRSNYTSYFHSGADYFDVDTVTSVRGWESRQLVWLLHGRHVALGQNESTLRYDDHNWEPEWFLANRAAVYAGNTHWPSALESERTAAVLEEYLSSIDADEVWFNIGAGGHADHKLTSEACLAVLSRRPELLSRFVVRMYQDVPYDAKSPGHVGEIVRLLRSWGAELESVEHSIADEFGTKVELTSVFASQFKVDAVRPDLVASATSNGVRADVVETLWTLERPPTHILPAALAPDSAEVAGYRAALAAMAPRLARATSIRLLLLTPSGRWRADIDQLLSAWPSARFDVYASPATCAEAVEYLPERVTMHRVGQGSRPWAVLALRLAVARPAPTFFAAGEERRHQAEQLARSWVRSPHLVVSSIGRLAVALRDPQAQGW